jgi:hypothetical protein
LFLSCVVASSACVTGGAEGDDVRIPPGATADGITADDAAEAADGDEVRFSESAPRESLTENFVAGTVATMAPVGPLAADTPDDPPLVNRVTKVHPPIAGVREGISLSAEQFSRLYCPNMSHCLLDRTGKLRHQRREKGLEGYIHAKTGKITLSIRRRKVIGGWYQVEQIDVLQGETYEFELRWRWRRPIKLEVKNAIGDVYHIAYRF